jgi:LacI family gluconate utilization system Gnt-I transcriptional repressor
MQPCSLRYEASTARLMARTQTALAPRGRKRRRRKMQLVTMNEVARVAEVSPSTVSLYLRKPDEVAQSTGQRIAQAIRSLRYVPNLVAGGLAAASSRVVSVIVPSVRNAFFAETVANLQEELAQQGLQLLLGHSEYSLEQEEALVRTTLSWSPAAIVLAGLEHSRTTRQLLMNTEVPVIEIWELGERPVDMAVGFSHREVGSAAARHLQARGCEQLAFLGARMAQDGRARQRSQGFAGALAEPASARILDQPEPASPAAGAMLLRRLLAQAPEVDGVVCSNDLVALGVLFECQRRRIAVPDELCVVGFGDLPFAAHCIPPLTTVRPPGGLIGRRVAELIARHLREGAIARADKVIDTGFELIERDSSARTAPG